MPSRASRVCFRCRNLYSEPRCPRCKPVIQAEKDRRRGSSTARGYDTRWRKAAQSFLARHPLCHYSAKLGLTRAAQCVDHSTPPSGPDDPLFWDESNWRPATIAHNSAKGRRTEAEYLAFLGVAG